MDIINAIIQGGLISLGLIVAIGAQNAFLLSQALKKDHAWKIAATCSFFDALLICLGVGGLNLLLEKSPNLTTWMAIFGIIFLVVYGALSFKRAMNENRLLVSQSKPLSTKKALLITLGLTLLNPHVYLDTVILIGAIANTKFIDVKWFFALGGVMASLVWFFGLVLFAKLLAPLFIKPITWRVLDFLIGITMWVIAYSLANYLI